MDQTMKTPITTVTAITTLVTSVQTQQQISKENRQQQEIVMETDWINREIEREQTRKETEETRRRIDEQRYQQTILDQKKDNKRNHAKLLEVEACNTKLIKEGIAQHQRTQERHDLEMQLVQERYEEEKEERIQNIKIAEEQRQEDNILQQSRFNAEQARIQNQISDDRYN